MLRISVSVLALSIVSAAPVGAVTPAKPAPAAAPLPPIGPDGKPKMEMAEAMQSFEALGYRFGNGTALKPLRSKPYISA